MITQLETPETQNQFEFQRTTRCEPRTELISACGIQHFFGSGSGRQQVLFDVSIKVYAGEVVLLRGHSGSGKTTLLSLIGALRSVQEGSLVVSGLQLKGASKPDILRTRRKIGYIFQHHNLLSFLTAAQNVQMSAELSGLSAKEARARSLEMLARVGLDQKEAFFPDNLSGGQRQRVAVARALVGAPSLILADEPTASLDSQSGRDVVDLLSELAREHNTAVLMVTHDIRVTDVADRLVEMSDGHICSGASV